MAQPPADRTPAERGDDAECVVCHEPIVGRRRLLGGRCYCAEHYARVASGSRGTWPSMLVLLAALLGFGLAMQVIGPALTPLLSGAWQLVVGLLLSLLPALLWLLVFQRLDRLEEEPRQYLLGVMLLGALLAGAIGEPLSRGLFALPFWSDGQPQWAIPVYSLTQGVLLVLFVYLAVRWTVFLLEEFDERADGVIYGTAAGLGVGVLYNIRYVLERDGLRLEVAAARIVVAALAIASVGGLVGYALGQIKFERHSVWYLPGVMVLAALLTGVFQWLSSEATTLALGYSAWAAVLIGAVFAALVFGAVFLLARSAVRETLATPGVT